MWEKAITGASTALFTAALAAIEAYGTTPFAAGLALFGAMMAMVEAETRHWLTRVMVLIFNALIGALGAPIVALAVRTNLGLEAPAVLLLASLAIGYLAHDMLGVSKVVIASRVSQLLRGRK
jgi:peptidoglycan/LPS O-acetylase OafA/YrhL